MPTSSPSYRQICLLILLLQTSVMVAYSQDKTDYRFGQRFMFDMITTTKRTMVTEPVYVPVSDTAVYRIFDRLKESRTATYAPKSPIMLGVKLNPLLEQYYSGLVQSVSKDYQTFVISDRSDALLIAMGINSGNVKDYRYRVVQNDSTELVHWSAIQRLEQRYGAKQAYGFIGKFNAPGRRLMVEVVNIKNYSIREGVVFDWRTSFKPVLSEIRVGTATDYFNIGYPRLNHGFASRFNKNGVPLDFRFYPDSVYRISIQLKKQETLVHSAYLIKTVAGKSDTSAWLGFVDHYGYFELYRSFFNNPGHYQLILKKQERLAVWNEKDMLRIPFDVLPPPMLAKQFSAKQLLLSSGVLIGLFVIYLLYTQRKLKYTQQQQANVQLKLKSVRSQLNPHFMFNALSSIQNLVNKNELFQANLYLSKFAGLTRKVLNSTEQEMITLEEELTLADDYLQMEQLRFGFKYQIEADAALTRVNIDIPAMLLQPFIENAVKHGIATLKQDGLIKVSVVANGHNLILCVADNGKGFDTGKVQSGCAFGLKLSKERIELLNQIYKNQLTGLHIASHAGSTIVSITLTNWI